MSTIVNHWTPKINTHDLETRLENALRRALGSVGFEIDLDRARMSTLKDTALDALNEGMAQSGPLLARMGTILTAAGSVSVGPNLSLKDLAGDIMYEFYTESTAAFSLGLVELSTEAEGWLKAHGVAEDRVRSVLDAAEKSYCLPDKEQFSREALPFVHEGLSLVSSTGLGTLTGLALGIVLTRAPHIGILGAFAGGGLGWYLARNRRRAKSQRLVRHLPRVLAKALFTQWNSNLNRYAEIINKAR